MKGFDAFAGVVKSGGKTRRAAKMVILDSGHPDILEFVDSKASEETQGLGPHRGRLRPLLHRRGLRLGLLPERQPQRARLRPVHAARSRTTPTGPPTRSPPARPAEHAQGQDHLPPHGRSSLDLRRPRHPVRHHHQRLEPGRQHRSPARHQPLLGVLVHQRHLLQPGLAEPDEVRRCRRRVRRRGLPFRRAPDHHGAGDPRRQRLATRRRRSRRTRIASARSAWATPTSARCS